MNKLFLPIALAGLLSTATQAQDLMILKYSVAFPTGDLNTYIGKTSWRGIGGGYRHLADANVAVGFDLGFQTFFEHKDYDTYTYGTASLTGVQYRYLWSTSISAQVDYVMNEGGDLRPFLGIGAGTMYAKRITDFGLYRFTQDPWQFLMKPEAGISYYMNSGNALLLSAEYSTAFETKELPGQSFITLNIGLIFSSD